jgi:hypothetical protein
MDIGATAVSDLKRLKFCAMGNKASRTVEYPKCALLLACDALVFDPNSIKPNLYGVFDNFTPAKLPGKVTFHVFLKLHGGKGRTPINIALVDPKGKPVPGASIDLDDFEGKPNQNAKIGALFLAELKVKGPHKLVVSSGSKVLGESTPIWVKVKPGK